MFEHLFKVAAVGRCKAKAQSREAGLQHLEDGGCDAKGSSVEEHGGGLHCQPPGDPRQLRLKTPLLPD